MAGRCVLFHSNGLLMSGLIAMIIMISLHARPPLLGHLEPSELIHYPQAADESNMMTSPSQLIQPQPLTSGDGTLFHV